MRFIVFPLGPPAQGTMGFNRLPPPLSESGYGGDRKITSELQVDTAASPRTGAA